MSTPQQPAATDVNLESDSCRPTFSEPPYRVSDAVNSSACAACEHYELKRRDYKFKMVEIIELGEELRSIIKEYRLSLGMCELEREIYDRTVYGTWWQYILWSSVVLLPPLMVAAAVLVIYLALSSILSSPCPKCKEPYNVQTEIKQVGGKNGDADPFENSGERIRNYFDTGLFHESANPPGERIDFVDPDGATDYIEMVVPVRCQPPNRPPVAGVLGVNILAFF